MSLKESTPKLCESQRRPDRRGHSRQAVDSRAKLILIRIGSQLAGRILDLSLSGCRIWCDERFPMGIYTRVEAEFCLDGLPFRLAGVVQAIHDRNTVGIRFLDMSNRKREQVEMLIEGLEMQGSGVRGQRAESREQRSGIRDQGSEIRKQGLRE